MCGIVCAFDLKGRSNQIRPQILKMARTICHRGPDWSGIYSDENAIMAHERLSIVDPKSGDQPLISKDGNLVLVVNGEIYNHLNIRKSTSNFEYQTNSDCESILALYEEKGEGFLDDLNGMFGFALYDKKNNTYLIARDHIGIIPLYIGWDQHETFYVASELKALEGYCSKIELFPPGHYYSSKSKTFKKWYQRDWMDYENVKDNKTDLKVLKLALEEAVQRQLMSDVPYGVLLSGGLDSSLTSAIAKKCTTNTGSQLHSFAIGLEGSPDLAASRKVAEYIGSEHHEIKYTLQEGLDAIRNVIYHLETYDVTTVRASTPMYILARVIKSMGIKMVLTGEGADEIFGGYLYFHKAPNAKEFHQETLRKLERLNQYDCLRANKSLAAWGVEGRVPFLDKEFIDVAMRINPEDKMAKNGRIEKWVVRKALEDYLPEEVLWRQKEQFSDGVGYGWIDMLRDFAEKNVSDSELKNAVSKFPINTPDSKEAYLYRNIFNEHFPSDQATRTVPFESSIACSTAIALEWDESFKNNADPSGRAVQSIHDDGAKFK